MQENVNPKTLDEVSAEIDRLTDKLVNDEISPTKAREITRMVNAKLKTFDQKLAAATLVAKYSPDKMPNLKQIAD